MSTPIRVGLIGAGYIATWHAEALAATQGVKITAVCDPNEDAAQALADAFGAAAVSSVDKLIKDQRCDAVHILPPPHLHEEIALQCLNAGLHVLVEKPVAENCKSAESIQALAAEKGLHFNAGHNFLGLPSYIQMKQQMLAGDYGRISAADFTWAYPLAPLRSGPYNLWLLRKPENLVLELGPHLMAFAQDLFGPVDISFAQASKPALLPGDDPRPQYIRFLGRAGDAELSFTISMVESLDDRSVTLRGSSGRARLDFAQDVLVVERENASDLIVNPLRKQLDLAGQHLAQGVGNAAVQLRSLNRKQPYARSFQGMNAAVYNAIAQGGAQDARFGGESAVQVMRALDQVIEHLPDQVKQVAAPAVQTRAPKPTAMVIGGTGFIGRALTRKLVAQGRDVRVLSRGKTGPFPDLPDRVETVGVSLHDLDGLTEAMRGMDVVFNLARSLENTWADCLKNDVGVALRIAMASEKAGVKRHVYTGTIASYDMSDPNVVISEQTSFAPDMTDRNLYARSKAECERKLMELHKQRGLPLVIARPGIVVGAGGPLQHWGIGRWHGAGAVRIWGHGRNILPFVLNDDVADGLVRMMDAPVEGQSFNLIGEPMLSARDYFDEIHRLLGARLRVSTGNLRAFYASDALKYGLKKYALRKPGLIRPSLADWKSRAHYSPFNNEKPKRLLGWQPVSDRASFLDQAITQANLIGF
jgi:predicted dehydrogenase/uncharacterized protein YbjT (DUF2867 family)